MISINLLCTIDVRYISDNLIKFLFQIKHMVAFIEQEANEKAEEIDAKVTSYYFTFLALPCF